LSEFERLRSNVANVALRASDHGESIVAGTARRGVGRRTGLATGKTSSVKPVKSQ
jgi:hypothetical protein